MGATDPRLVVAACITLLGTWTPVLAQPAAQSLGGGGGAPQIDGCGIDDAGNHRPKVSSSHRV